MKRIAIVLIMLAVFFSSASFAANVGRELNNKCRQNIKLLNNGTELMLKKTSRELPRWVSYKQAIKDFLYPDKYLEDKTIVGPTPDCEYYLVSNDNNDYQWLCYLHGVLDGNKTLSFRYHEHQFQGKTSDRFMSNEQYKKHVQNMLHWTEYSPTPKEFLLYHYNMNPIVTTIICVVLVVGSFYLIKSFFKF